MIQGAAGAILPLAFGIVRDEFPREKVGSAIGITAALLAVGGGLGIVLAGPIVDALDYHYLFWLPLVFVVLSALAAFFFVPESEVRTPGRISPLAASLLTGTLVAMLVALSEGSTWGWGSGRTLGLFGAAVLLAIGWVRVELTSASPLVDMKMMRLPAVWTTNLVALLFGMGMYAIIGFLPEFLQTPKSAGYGFGASITASGLYLLPMTITMFIAGIYTGRLVGRIGSKLVLVIGSAVTAVPMAVLAFAHTQSWEIYLASSLLGAGSGPGLLLDVDADRRVRLRGADRCGQRHERQHPYHRRLHRCGRHVDHHHGQGLRRAACPRRAATPTGSPSCWPSPCWQPSRPSSSRVPASASRARPPPRSRPTSR